MKGEQTVEALDSDWSLHETGCNWMYGLWANDGGFAVDALNFVEHCSAP